MQVTVSGRHTEVSEALRAAAVEKIGRLERFLDGMTRAEVHFDHHGNPRIAEKEICEVTVEGQGHVVRCKASAVDSFAAVDAAVDKLEHQLRRLKTKLRGKAAAAGGHRAPKVNGVVAAPEPEEDLDHSMADDAYVTRAGELVVKKKSFAITPVSVDDAVLQMELVGHSFYFFTNAATGRAAVLYRRDDGKLGLIDQA